jgi:hypothetical protein
MPWGYRSARQSTRPRTSPPEGVISRPPCAGASTRLTGTLVIEVVDVVLLDTLMSRRTAVLPLVVATALCGCIASVKYPSDWAEIRVSECADLSGAYENHGSAHRPTQMWSGPLEITPTWLAPLFFHGEGRELSDARKAVKVRIDARTPKQLGVTATMPDGREVPIVLHEEENNFRCREGKIEFSATDLGFAFVIVGAGTTSYQLSKAADGALIVAGHDRLVGTALIWIPIYWSSRTYARFGPAR